MQLLAFQKAWKILLSTNHSINFCFETGWHGRNFSSYMPFRQTDVQKYARAHIKSSELESEFILGTWLWIILKHAIGLTFHRSCCILSKNFRLFIFRSLFCISSWKCLKSYPNERTFSSRSGFDLHRFLQVLSHFHGFEPQWRTYFFYKFLSSEVLMY